MKWLALFDALVMIDDKQFPLNDYAILYLKVRPLLQWRKNYSKKFLPFKGTLRDKQCLRRRKL